MGCRGPHHPTVSNRWLHLSVLSLTHHYRQSPLQSNHVAAKKPQPWKEGVALLERWDPESKDYLFVWEIAVTLTKQKPSWAICVSVRISPCDISLSHHDASFQRLFIIIVQIMPFGFKHL